MKATFYDIGNLIIMEIFTGIEYEYYCRAKNDVMDIFRFEFGAVDRFEIDALNNLYMAGYFNS